MAVSTIDPNGLNIGQIGGTRNKIINGAMQVWQRGTSRTFSNTQYVAVDRFQPGQFQKAAYERVEVVGPGPRAKFALRVTSSNTSEAPTGTRMAVGQMIEHANSIHTAGQAVTLSFWIKFSAASIANAGDFLVRIWEFDTINPSFAGSGPTRQTGITLTNGSLPTSWIKYTTTVTTASTAKTLAPRFSFTDLFNTTNNSDFSYDITEIQLEQGDTATPFEHRSYGQELALCQRYFQTLGGAAYTRFASGFCGSTTGAYFGLPFILQMRSAPTASNTGGFAVYHGSLTVTAATSLVFTDATTTSIAIAAAAASGLTTNGGTLLIANNDSTAKINLSAEL